MKVQQLVHTQTKKCFELKGFKDGSQIDKILKKQEEKYPQEKATSHQRLKDDQNKQLYVPIAPSLINNNFGGCFLA